MSLQKTSNWWYLLPFFFNVFGGITMFIVLRKEDYEEAKTGLFIGIIVTAIELALYFLLLRMGLRSLGL